MAPCRRVPLDRPFLKQLATARRIVPSLAVNIAFSASAIARSGSEELAALEQSSAMSAVSVSKSQHPQSLEASAFGGKDGRCRYELSVFALALP